MAEIKNSQQDVQISQNQSPISIQLSMKTIIALCSSWTFFGYNWVMWPGSKIKRTQLRLAPLFQKSLVIVSDHFLTLDLFLNATVKKWKEWMGFADTELYAKSFKKKIIKKFKYSRSSPSCYWGVFLLFWLTQKDRFLKPIEKKIFNYWGPVSAAIALFWWSRRFIYFFFVILL